MSQPSDQVNPQPPQPTFLWPIAAIALATVMAIALIVLALVQQTAAPASSADVATTQGSEIALLADTAPLVRRADAEFPGGRDEIVEVRP